jgi:hypothetical protein
MNMALSDVDGHKRGASVDQWAVYKSATEITRQTNLTLVTIAIGIANKRFYDNTERKRDYTVRRAS